MRPEGVTARVLDSAEDSMKHRSLTEEDRGREGRAHRRSRIPRFFTSCQTPPNVLGLQGGGSECRHPRGVPAFGRSMVIDPWGTVVAQAPDGVGIIRADIDMDRVAAVRRQIPSLANRRPEAYRLD
ncbi:MAG: nitrilase-related carbon-nitrogen hydrolase [Candidatus Limnocylindrales bacterium]